MNFQGKMQFPFNFLILIPLVVFTFLSCSSEPESEGEKASTKQTKKDEKTVVSTIKPLHLITQALMQNVGQADVIIQSSNVHGFQLSPSHLKRMLDAEFVVGIGDHFEGNVAGIFDENDFTLEQYFSKINLLEVRENLRWDDHDHQHPASNKIQLTSKNNTLVDLSSIDKHFWLSSINARAFANALSLKLIAHFPESEKDILFNLAQLNTQIQTLEQQFSNWLNEHEKLPFMVFHDGFHYLTAQYLLNEVAAVVSDPSDSTGIKTILELKEIAIKEQVKCIFVEPGFNQSLVDTFKEAVYQQSGLNIQILAWDVLGLEANTYPELISNIYQSYQLCQ